MGFFLHAPYIHPATHNASFIAPYTIADGQGSPHVTIIVTLAAGAIGDTDIVLPYGVRVDRAQCILAGAGVVDCTCQIKNGANPITNAILVNGADKAITYNVEIDDAFWEIPATGTLRITTATGATQPAVHVMVFGTRI